MTPTQLDSKQIKAEALSLGFSAVGIAPSGCVDKEYSERYERWIAAGHHATMNYMEAHADLRANPSLLLDGCQSVVCVALSYFPQQPIPSDRYQLAYYAYGHDYHDVMRRKLSLLAEHIAATVPANCNLMTRSCVDTAPLMERYWAVRAGLGWVGRNHTLILPRQGSFFFLGELLINQAVDIYDQPLADGHCGECHRCIDACPGHALGTDGSFDCRRCLSYLTIENRQTFTPSETDLIRKSTPYYIYGCDRCQLACPHNHHPQPNTTPEFQPSARLLSMTNDDWHHLTREQYQELFRHSAVKRAKYEGLLRNIDAVARLAEPK